MAPHIEECIPTGTYDEYNDDICEWIPVADTQHKTNDDSPEANHAHNLMKISSQLHREVEDSDGKPCSDYSEKKS